MKKLFLTLMCCILSSISFGQVDKKTQQINIDVKKNTVIVADFLESQLKLDKKQKQICLNAYAEYGNNLNIARKKIAAKKNKDQKLSNQTLIKTSIRFVKMRDMKIKDILSKKQFTIYNEELLKFINPLTLQIEKKRKK
jgi:FlaA1/EpsC-like NDP-sugar epimerase